MKNKIGSLILLNMFLPVNSGIVLHTVFNQRAITTSCNPLIFPAEANRLHSLESWNQCWGSSLALCPFWRFEIILSSDWTEKKHQARCKPMDDNHREKHHKRFSLGENHKGPGSSTQHRLAPSLLSFISPLNPTVLPSFQQFFE